MPSMLSESEKKQPICHDCCNKLGLTFDQEIPRDRKWSGLCEFCGIDHKIVFLPTEAGNV